MLQQVKSCCSVFHRVTVCCISFERVALHFKVMHFVALYRELHLNLH